MKVHQLDGKWYATLENPGLSLSGKSWIKLKGFPEVIRQWYVSHKRNGVVSCVEYFTVYRSPVRTFTVLEVRNADSSYEYFEDGAEPTRVTVPQYGPSRKWDGSTWRDDTQPEQIEVVEVPISDNAADILSRLSARWRRKGK